MNEIDGSFDNVEFEKVSCLICGSTDHIEAGSVESHKAVFPYVLCTTCGLKYMSPRPTRQWYEAHYAKQFWEYKKDNRSWRDKDKKWRLRDFLKRNFSGRQRVQAKRLSLLNPLIRANSKLGRGKKMLDIGCAFGVIGAGIAREFGCEVYGVEPNASAREVAKTQNGIKILAENAEELIDLKGHDGEFDLILMSNVMENILDPGPILSASARLLSKEGVLCIHMPNFFFYDAMNPYHPYIYSPDTLVRIQLMQGLDVFSVQATEPVRDDTDSTRKYGKADRFVTTFARPGKTSRKLPQISDPQELLMLQAKSLAKIG